MPFGPGYVRSKTFAPGGDCLPGDLNSLQDQLGNSLAVALLGQYQTIAETRSIAESTAAGSSGIKILTNRLVRANGTAFGTSTPPPGGVAAVEDLPAIVRVNAAEHAVSGMTAKLRIAAAAAASAVSPASTFTFGLYPVAFTGTQATLTTTLGAVVASSTIALAPGASGELTGASSDINLPADGIYCLGVSLSAGVASLSSTVLLSTLQVRHV